jgi:hypothetical protein
MNTKIGIIIVTLACIAGIELILFLVYVFKYTSIKTDYHNLLNNKNNNKDYDNYKNYENYENYDNETIQYPEKNSNISIIINSYDVYYNTDFYYKYDLLDQFNDKIAIFSININNCYLICELLSNCYGFARFHNYCYLKSKYNLIDKNELKNVTLILKVNKLESNSSILHDNQTYYELF